MFALIINNQVHELFANQPVLPANLTVIDVSAYPNVAQGWIYASDGTVSAPPTSAPATMSSSDLLAYADIVRDAKANIGISVNVAPTGQTAIILSVDTTATGRTNILGLESLAAKGKPIIWIESTGPVTLTQDQIDLIAVTTGQYLTNVYTAWGNIVSSINSGSTAYTTTDQINNAGWPAVTY